MIRNERKRNLVLCESIFLNQAILRKVEKVCFV